MTADSHFFVLDAISL